MRTVEIEIDGQITLAECMRMASSIGATLRGGPGGRLIITRASKRVRTIASSVNSTSGNIIPIGGHTCAR